MTLHFCLFVGQSLGIIIKRAALSSCLSFNAVYDLSSYFWQSQTASGSFGNLNRHSATLIKTRTPRISWVICICALSRGRTSFCSRNAPANLRSTFIPNKLLPLGVFFFLSLCSVRPDHPALLSEFISVRGAGRSFPQPCSLAHLHRDQRQSAYKLRGCWVL